MTSQNIGLTVTSRRPGNSLDCRLGNKNHDELFRSHRNTGHGSFVVKCLGNLIII